MLLGPNGMGIAPETIGFQIFAGQGPLEEDNSI